MRQKSSKNQSNRRYLNLSPICPHTFTKRSFFTSNWFVCFKRCEYIFPLLLKNAIVADGYKWFTYVCLSANRHDNGFLICFRFNDIRHNDWAHNASVVFHFNGKSLSCDSIEPKKSSSLPTINAQKINALNNLSSFMPSSIIEHSKLQKTYSSPVHFHRCNCFMQRK